MRSGHHLRPLCTDGHRRTARLPTRTRVCSALSGALQKDCLLHYSRIGRHQAWSPDADSLAKGINPPDVRGAMLDAYSKLKGSNRSRRGRSNLPPSRCLSPRRPQEASRWIEFTSNFTTSQCSRLSCQCKTVALIEMVIPISTAPRAKLTKGLLGLLAVQWSWSSSSNEGIKDGLRDYRSGRLTCGGGLR
jgi:hypothetical protein